MEKKKFINISLTCKTYQFKGMSKCFKLILQFIKHQFKILILPMQFCLKKFRNYKFLLNLTYQKLFIYQNICINMLRIITKKRNFHFTIKQFYQFIITYKQILFMTLCFFLQMNLKTCKLY